MCRDEAGSDRDAVGGLAREEAKETGDRRVTAAVEGRECLLSEGLIEEITRSMGFIMGFETAASATAERGRGSAACCCSSRGSL